MIKIANAPCSWGALEFDLEGEAPGYVQVLDEIAETGYAGTELGDWGFMPTDPQNLAQEIHGRNLLLLGAFVPVFLKDPSAHQAGIEVACAPRAYWPRWKANSLSSSLPTKTAKSRNAQRMPGGLLLKWA